MKVAFILLCSGETNKIFRTIDLPYFKDPDNRVYVHYDRSNSDNNYKNIVEHYANRDDVVVLADRIHCAWGEFSLVEATLRLMQAALNDEAFVAEYVYLISESCFPIRPFSQLQAFLAENRLDFLEMVDPNIRRWVTDGDEMERLHYRFPFNFQTRRRWFELAFLIQKKLQWKRKLPNLPTRFGAQWMCIRRDSAQKAINTLSDRRLRQFLKYSWIPDEFAIQSAIADAIPPSQAANAALTYYEFGDDGKPIVFYNDSAKALANQPFFFARKLSPHADKLVGRTMMLTNADPGPKSAGDLVASPDYGVFRAQVTERRAPVGGVDDSWHHPLDKVKVPFFCVSGVSRRYIRALLGAMAGWNNQDVHGYVFENDQIDMLPHKRLFYSADDINIRNYAPLVFLYNIIAKDERETVFALDWSDMSSVRDRLIWHERCHVILVDPPGHKGWTRQVFRLKHREIHALLRLPKYERRQAVVKLFEKDDIGYWDRIAKNSHKCTITKLKKDKSGISDGIRAAMKDIAVTDVFEPEYFELLESIR